MGISLVRKADGSLLITHDLAGAQNLGNAAEGLAVMQEIVESARKEARMENITPCKITVTSALAEFEQSFFASPAQFGLQLKADDPGISGVLGFADPDDACSPNVENVTGKVAIVKRGGCMFVEKARHVQDAGAIGMIVVDNKTGSQFVAGSAFAMSGDNGKSSVTIPALFLYSQDAVNLVTAHFEFADLVVTLHR